MRLLSENDLLRLGEAMRRCQKLSLVRTLGGEKVRASVVEASSAHHVAMLVRLERWWPDLYSTQYFESVEGLREALLEEETPHLPVAFVPHRRTCSGGK